MKAELLDYVASHTAPSGIDATAWAWDAAFEVTGFPTRNEVQNRMLATPGMEVLLDGKWHDVLQAAQLMNSPEMALRLMVLGHKLFMFEVAVPMPNLLAFRAIGRFKNMFGKDAFDPMKRFEHVHG